MSVQKFYVSDIHNGNKFLVNIFTEEVSLIELFTMIYNVT